MKNTKQYIDFSSLLIDRLGGTYRTAAMRGVSPPSVSNWRIKGVPHLRMESIFLHHRHIIRKLSAETGFDVVQYIKDSKDSNSSF